MKKKTVVLGIDIQNDFTLASGALYVQGADGDVCRMVSFFEKNGPNIDYVILTMDSHQPIHIANQCYWKDIEGYPPALYTVVSLADVEQGLWFPQFNKDLAIPYLEALEAKGEVCTIWPAHCVLGSSGWCINSMLTQSLYSWSIAENRSYELCYKGMHQATEHYSIFRAAVEYETAEETKLNTNLLNKLKVFDRILLMGEAADYCVVNSLNDLLDFSPELATKILVLTDCMSWIDGANERAIYLFEKAKKMGVGFANSSEFIF